MLLLLGVDRARDIDFTAPVREEVPTRKDFFINWWEPIESAVNTAAVDVLMYFLVEKRTVDWGNQKESVIQDKIRRHIKFRRKYYLDRADAQLKATKGLAASAATRSYQVSSFAHRCYVGQQVTIASPPATSGLARIYPSSWHRTNLPASSRNGSGGYKQRRGGPAA